MNLKNVKDSKLVGEVKCLVKKERELSTKILHYLAEIDKRKLFCDYGCSSLFSFCTTILGYSSGAAKRRIDAARLIVEIPEVEDKIKEGSLALSSACQLQNHFKKNHTSGQDKREIINSVENQSTREIEKTLFELSGQDPIVKEKERAIGSDHTEVKMVLSEGQWQLWNALKGRLAHRKFKSSGDLLEIICQLALKEMGRGPSKKIEAKAPAKRTRHIPNAIRREVMERANGRCEWVDPKTKKRCQSSYAIQLDHIKPYAKGGEHSLENLRVCCRNHNLRWAILEFGVSKVTSARNQIAPS